MNRIKLFLILLFIANLTYGQDVKMTTEYSSENQDVSDILQFENIDLYKTKFVGKDINQKNYVLLCKEVWNGKIKKTDTIIDTSKYPSRPKAKSDTINLKVIAKHTEETKLKLWFRFPEFGINRKYDAIKSDDYSLRDVGISEEIKYGENFYAFAYILPYEKDGMKFWCAVDSSGKDIASWGTEFGIEHYLIFEMKFE